MTKFSDQLYADLMRQHGSTLANTTLPVPSPRHITPRGALVATGAGGLAAAAAAGAMVAGGGSPAYALTTNHDHTITLAVYQLSGIAQANAKLRQLGDNVVVVPVRAGCPRPLPPAVRAHEISVGVSGARNGPITVNAHGIPAGDILVIGIETTGHFSETGSVLTSPPAPACISLPGPPPGSGGPGTGTSHGSGGGRSVNGAA